MARFSLEKHFVSGTYRIATANAAGFSHVGRRDNNEDSFCVVPAMGLFVVADGMGGYEGGEVASKLVVDAVVSFFVRSGAESSEDLAESLSQPHGGRTVAHDRMETALRIAHRDVCDAAVGTLKEMGSTVAALLLGNGNALLAHVGDSRVYRIRGGVAELLTRDHSVVADLQAANCASMLDHLPVHYSHMITRSLSSGADARPDFEMIDTRPGDMFILCTDGLHDVLAPAEIASFAGDATAGETSRALCDAAYEAGGLDNITVVAVRVLGEPPQKKQKRQETPAPRTPDTLIPAALVTAKA